MNVIGKMTTQGYGKECVISCQNLLSQPGVTHSGQLLKQSAYHKKTSFVSTMLAKFPWVSRYVVLHKGHLYHYRNSMSKKPSGYYSLRNYYKIVQVRDVSLTRHPWAFMIVHRHSAVMSKYFAAASERELLLWMKEIRNQIVIANSDRGSKAAVSEDISSLEESVYDIGRSQQESDADEHSSEEEDEDEYIVPGKEYDNASHTKSGSPTATRNPKPAPRQPAESAPTQSTSEGGQVINDEEEYLDVDIELESRLRKRAEKLNLPTTGGVDISAGYSLKKETPPGSPQSTHFGGLPVPAPPMKYKTPPPLPPAVHNETKLQWSLVKEASWEGTNTKECEMIIRHINQDGAYLLRDSSNCAKTLICLADGQLVKFMIRKTPKKKYNIEKDRNFDTMEGLLKYYSENNLPNKSTMLTKPYKKLL